MTIVVKIQGGNLVFNPENIYVCKDEKGFTIRTITTMSEELGTYKTKKRAEEIIADIYRRLEDVGSIREYVGCPVFAYEMPKE